MSDWHETLKFIAALIAVVVLSYSGHSSEAAMVGLIGVLGTFKGRTPPPTPPGAQP